MATTRPVTFRFTPEETARLDALVELFSGGNVQTTPTRTQVMMKAVQALEEKSKIGTPKQEDLSDGI